MMKTVLPKKNGLTQRYISMTLTVIGLSVKHSY